MHSLECQRLCRNKRSSAFFVRGSVWGCALFYYQNEGRKTMNKNSENSPIFLIFGIVIFLLTLIVAHIGVKAGLETFEIMLIDFALLLAIMLIIAIIANIVNITRQNSIKKEERRFQDELRYGNIGDSIKFYQMCVDAGIPDIDKEANKKRLELFAKSKGIQGTQKELEIAFQKGYDKIEGEKHDKRLAALRIEENKIYAQNRQYISFFGREKRIQYYQDILNAATGNSKVVSDKIKTTEKFYANGGASAFNKAERDWAVEGGAISGAIGGTAGVVAGLSNALNAQQHNADVRAYNQAMTDSMNQLGVAYLLQLGQSAAKSEQSIQLAKENIEKAKRSLVEEQSAEKLFQYLDIKVIEKKVSETGAGIVKVQVKYAKPLIIYDDVQAVVDGSIKVILKDKNKAVAEGVFVLPDSMRYSYNTDVICKGSSTIPEDFDVSFRPNKLWAIEA